MRFFLKFAWSGLLALLLGGCVTAGESTASEEPVAEAAQPDRIASGDCTSCPAGSVPFALPAAYYGGVPAGYGSSYGSAPAGYGSSYGRAPVGYGSYYGSAPAGYGSSYGGYYGSSGYWSSPGFGTAYGGPASWGGSFFRPASCVCVIAED